MKYKNFLILKKKFLNKYIENHALLLKKNYYNLTNYNLLIYFNTYG